jgi:hypothetical protein
MYKRTLNQKKYDELVGKIKNKWKILSIEKYKKPTRFCYAECQICGRKERVAIFSILNGSSTRCKFCKKRKWDLKSNPKARLLNQTWRKYKGTFCDEWQNFDVFYNFMIDILKWKPNTYRLTRKNTKIKFSPDNVYLKPRTKNI